MNLCRCGCGQLCAKTWVRGHNHRSDTPNVRYVYSVPVQRVLPLVEFLFTEHPSNVAAARAIGVSEWAVRRWRSGSVRRVSPKCARRIVEAVKAHEAALREETGRTSATRERYHYRGLHDDDRDPNCRRCTAVTA